MSDDPRAELRIEFDHISEEKKNMLTTELGQRINEFFESKNFHAPRIALLVFSMNNSVSFLTSCDPPSLAQALKSIAYDIEGNL